ncbi:hypothetical protein LMG33818_001238 [Halomonadaceae bacterium LMG 33818]|uniref:ArsR/SmtB family transcription factor n=1 Tax=Cernens ardua TaxID=3402176 RepID=UPI003EDC64BB
MKLTAEMLSSQLAAIASPQRMRILACLADEAVHVSELARRVGMSRPLLYMHLTKLEEAGFVSSTMALSESGKALKFFSIQPFDIHVTPNAIVQAVHAENSDISAISTKED